MKSYIPAETFAGKGLGEASGDTVLLEHQYRMVAFGKRRCAGKSPDAGTYDDCIPGISIRHAKAPRFIAARRNTL
jgi:hypothetical protein